MEDAAKQSELASLFGLTPEERDDVRGGAVAVAERLRQQHDEEESFF